MFFFFFRFQYVFVLEGSAIFVCAEFILGCNGNFLMVIEIQYEICMIDSLMLGE